MRALVAMDALSLSCEDFLKFDGLTAVVSGELSSRALGVLAIVLV